MLVCRPVFKAGEGLVNSGAGGFDSHALPPSIAFLTQPPRLSLLAPLPVTAHPASQRAIDTSNLPLALKAMRAGFGILQLISRSTAVRLAARLFVQPRRHRSPERERLVLVEAARSTVRHKGKDIAVYAWDPRPAGSGGESPPTILLVHGWEGRGGQLGAFVAPLLGAGMRVVAFDHVGHGESDGRACALPTMRDTLHTLAESFLMGPPDGVIAHSMGSFAVSLAMADGWRETAAVYVSPPDDLLVYFGRYLELVTGSRDLLPDMIELMEERFGEAVEEFEFRHLVETLNQPLLVLHSTDDPDVPIDGGRFVAEHWPGAAIREFEGLGHRRILRDPEVHRAATDFLVESLRIQS